MENKAIVEGIIVNQLTLNKFGGTFIKLHNKRSYEYQGKTMESNAFINITVGEKIAKQIVERFKKGDIVRVEGFLKPKEVKDVTDANGYKIYEECIVARSVDALQLVDKQQETQTRMNQDQLKSYNRDKAPSDYQSSIVGQKSPHSDKIPVEFDDNYEELPF